MKIFRIGQSTTEFYTSHSGLALVGLCLNQYCSLAAMAKAAFPLSPGTKGIGIDDIVRSSIALLTLGKTDYEAIANHREDEFFRAALDIKQVPSRETLRQRLDAAAAMGLRPIVEKCSLELLSRLNVPITPLENGYVPLDCDVFAMDNSKTQKEGVSRIYNGQDGYAPIGAYLGKEGWCLELELREGKQHSQCEFIPFLNRVLDKARELTTSKLLVRLDSAHDAIDTRVTLANREDVDFIIKWNPRKTKLDQLGREILAKGQVTSPRKGKRIGLLTVTIDQVFEGKTYRFKRVMRAVERTIDRHGQQLIPEIEVEGWWTMLDLSEEEVIELYEDHGTSEQFHSEIKSDLDLERLPSGKFATNALILSLGAMAYNILRAIGQLGLVEGKTPLRNPASRRRIKTVLQELMYLAARLIKTGRRLKLLFSRHCNAYGVFEELYERLAYG